MNFKTEISLTCRRRNCYIYRNKWNRLSEMMPKTWPPCHTPFQQQSLACVSKCVCVIVGTNHNLSSTTSLCKLWTLQLAVVDCFTVGYIQLLLDIPVTFGWRLASTVQCTVWAWRGSHDGLLCSSMLNDIAVLAAMDCLVIEVSPNGDNLKLRLINNWVSHERLLWSISC